MVDSLLNFIDQVEPGGFFVAATNLGERLDSAIWRRFDEVVWFDHPDEEMTRKYINNAFKNSRFDFEIEDLVKDTTDYSYAELEKICNQAKKSSLLDRRKSISRNDISEAIRNADRHRMDTRKLAIAG